MPLLLSEFRLNLLGRFLSLAIAALGIDLIWGYTGLLSLGHGIFFGLGGYAIGTNGLIDFTTLFGATVSDAKTQFIFYTLTVVFLAATYGICR